LQDRQPNTFAHEQVGDVWIEIFYMTPANPKAERFKWAVGRPPQMGVNLSIQKIQQRLAEVNSEAMVLLHSTAHRIEEQLRDDMQQIGQKYDSLKKSNEDLQKQNEELKKQNEDIQAKLESKFTTNLKDGTFYRYSRRSSDP
jgi:hypothetical protein